MSGIKNGPRAPFRARVLLQKSTEQTKIRCENIFTVWKNLSFRKKKKLFYSQQNLLHRSRHFNPRNLLSSRWFFRTVLVLISFAVSCFIFFSVIYYYFNYFDYTCADISGSVYCILCGCAINYSGISRQTRASIDSRNKFSLMTPVTFTSVKHFCRRDDRKVAIDVRKVLSRVAGLHLTPIRVIWIYSTNNCFFSKRKKLFYYWDFRFTKQKFCWQSNKKFN